MIPDDALNRQLSRFSILAQFDAVLDDPTMHKRACKEADSEAQLEKAVTILILQEGRQFCPKPGEIVDIIRTIAVDEQMAEDRPAETAKGCWRCHGLGFFRTTLDNSGIQIPCTCARGRVWRNLHPDVVAAFDAAADAAEKLMSERKPAPKSHREKPGGLARVSQILGRELR